VLPLKTVTGLRPVKRWPTHQIRRVTGHGHGVRKGEVKLPSPDWTTLHVNAHARSCSDDNEEQQSRSADENKEGTGARQMGRRGLPLVVIRCWRLEEGRDSKREGGKPIASPRDGCVPLLPKALPLAYSGSGLWASTQPVTCVLYAPLAPLTSTIGHGRRLWSGYLYLEFACVCSAFPPPPRTRRPLHVKKVLSN
jgi:hypothetical protein